MKPDLPREADAHRPLVSPATAWRIRVWLLWLEAVVRAMRLRERGPLDG